LACWVQAEIVDMHTGKTSVVPSSQGKLAGLWVTQDTLVTGNTEKTNFQTFNLKTQKWTDLGPKNLGNIVNWMISPDGKYLSFTTEGAEPNVERIRLAEPLDVQGVDFLPAGGTHRQPEGLSSCAGFGND
jgi:hypothetical protein